MFVLAHAASPSYIATVEMTYHETLEETHLRLEGGRETIERRVSFYVFTVCMRSFRHFRSIEGLNRMTWCVMSQCSVEARSQSVSRIS
jgi:hypothetical protein